MPLPRCYFAYKIYRFLIPDAVVWLLLIPDGINGVQKVHYITSILTGAKY